MQGVSEFRVPLNEVICDLENSDGVEPHPDVAEGLLTLSRTLLAEPRAVLQELVETAKRLAKADSCGVSLLDENGENFRWVATSGAFSQYLHATLPRHFSPCGVVLDRKKALMMLDPDRHFPYIAELTPPVHTVLLVPFSQNNSLIGTIWVVRHSPGAPFTKRDLNAVSAVAEFASSLFQAASQLTEVRRGEEKAEKLLAQSETARRLLQTGFQQSPGFVAVLRGEDFVFELANEAYMQLVGVRDLVGKRLVDALPALEGQGFEMLLASVFRTGKAHVGNDVRVDLTDEEGSPYTRYVDFVYQPLTNGDGKVVGILVQGHDVTKQHHAFSQLRQESETKEKFLSVLSHELRNPLASIRLSALLLRTTSGKEDPRQVRAVQILENQTSVMLRLVDDMVDVQSIRTGKLQLHVDDVLLQDVFAMAVEAMQQYISLRGHTLELQVGEEPIYARGDSVRLVQVFTNLLSNAAKYSPEGSVIHLCAEPDGDDTVVVRVQDEGIGIAKDFLPRIFEMYIQAPKTDAFHQGGLGLGLALVRQLVELHKGTITAHSDGLGKGSCFTVRLPASDPAPS